MSAARVAAIKGAGLGLAALLHAGWWLEWQTRTEPGHGCRELLES
jgi:hypothetical protein